LFFLILAFVFTVSPILRASDERSDWAELPSELLSSAGGYLNYRDFVTRLRPVCSKWSNAQAQWSEFCSIMGHKLSRLLKATRARSLRSVSILNGLSLKDEELGHLSTQQDLQHLGVNFGPLLTDVGITYLPGLVQRVVLNDCPQITGLTMQHLQNLRSVTLGGCDVGDEGLRSMTGCSQLNSLFLFECEKVTNEGLRYLSATQLQRLALSNSEVITDEGLAHLGRLSCLQILALEKLSKITDAGIASLPLLTLSELSLGYLDKVTGQTLPRLQGLTSLKIYNCKKLSDRGLEILAHLASLYLHDCPSISECKLTGLGACSSLKNRSLQGEVVIDTVLACLG
ncbi:MAG: hypothetical protein ACREGC_04300, partial [Minisyncoccia bacterium]